MFSEEYRAANDRIKADPALLSQIKQKAGESEKRKPVRPAVLRLTYAAASVALAAVLAVAVLVPALQHKSGPLLGDAETPVPAAPVKTAQTYDDIYSAVMEIYAGRQNDMDGGIFFAEDEVATNAAVDFAVPEAAPEMRQEWKSAAQEIPAADGEIPKEADGAAEGEYSETNAQVAGVDEGDIVKTDGKYIYILRMSCLTIVDPQTMTELCTVPAKINTTEMYIRGDRVVLVGEALQSEVYTDPRTAICVFDVSDRTAPKRLTELSQSGWGAQTRMVGDWLYTVSSYYEYNEPKAETPETFVPTLACGDDLRPMEAGDVCLTEGADSVSYVVVTAFNVADGADFASQRALLGNSSAIYADTDNLIVAGAKTTQDTVSGSDADGAFVRTESVTTTTLTLFSLREGEIGNVASGEVAGTPLNQFSMDEYDGHYRIVTTDDRSTRTIHTDGIDRYDFESVQTSGVYVLDGGLNLVGSLDGLAEDERVYSVRFDGDIAYFVTFRQTDPLFAVDLSDPAAPKIVSELKLPGFSSYLHPYGDGLLLGIGQSADEEGRVQGMKLSMFDVSDPLNVTETQTMKLDYTYSEALYNHRAVLISPERELIGIPVNTEDGREGFAVFTYAEEGFSQLAFIETQSDVWKMRLGLRGLYIGDTLYVCTSGGVTAWSMPDYQQTGSLTLSEIRDEDMKLFVVN